MKYKQYFKGKGKNTIQNPLGATIGEDVKNCDEKGGKKVNHDDKKVNPVQNSCKASISQKNPLHIVF